MKAQPLPTVLLQTELGDIHIELFIHAAPLSSSNFLAYVDQELWTDASFYRAMRREHWSPGRELCLVQGGLTVSARSGLPPIPHESGVQTGLKHVRGALSYARLAPGSAASEFFICVEDCPGLDPTDDPVPPADGLGYAVFGRVVAGMAVVEAIHRSATAEDAPSELLKGQIIARPVAISAARRQPQP